MPHPLLWMTCCMFTDVSQNNHFANDIRLVILTHWVLAKHVHVNMPLYVRANWTRIGPPMPAAGRFRQVYQGVCARHRWLRQWLVTGWPLILICCRYIGALGINVSDFCIKIIFIKKMYFKMWSEWCHTFFWAPTSKSLSLLMPWRPQARASHDKIPLSSGFNDWPHCENMCWINSFTGNTLSTLNQFG